MAAIDSSANLSGTSSIGLRAILIWLATPMANDPVDDLLPLRAHLLALREIPAPDPQRLEVLEQLHRRATAVIRQLFPGLRQLALPLPRKARFQVKGMQEVLQLLAEDELAAAGVLRLNPPDDESASLAILFTHALCALSLHLRISYLVAAPPANGVWRLMHEIILAARSEGLDERIIDAGTGSIRQIYINAALLASAQPASFTSGEIDLAVDIIDRMGDAIRLLQPGAPRKQATLFWIDPLRDVPPMANNRVPAPSDALLAFDCSPLADQLEHCLAALGEGHPPATLELPDICAGLPGQAVLRRLVHYWGSPGKRRFPRRRQSYRAQICASLPALWRLFRGEPEAAEDNTSWMITNESPDGYAAMHIAGRTRNIGIGDVIALRTESGSDWQVCIVRWALSENPEHLELGLQILAPQARPGELAKSPGSGNSTTDRSSVLVLPSLPPLRPDETVIAPAGTVAGDLDKPMVLLIEQSNLEVRQIRPTRIDEQTGSIEIFSIRTDLEP